MIRNIDPSVWKLAQYFVRKHHYRFVDVQQMNNEIWLSNPNHQKYPIIRVTNKTINSTFFDKQKIDQIHQAIKKVLQVDLPLLDIHTVGYDADDFDDDIIQVIVDKASVNPDFILQDFNDIIKAFSYDEPQPIIQPKKQVSKNKFLAFLKEIPPVTLGFSIFLIVVFLFITFMSRFYEDRVALAIVFGSYYKVFIIANQEWWRFLTAGFIHIDFTHVFMNVLALINLGMITEKLFGSTKYAMILFFSIIMGSWFVFIGQGNVVLLGASGGIYGLMGALFVFSFESGIIKQPHIRSQFTRILLINLFISLLPGVSFLGHLGGFVSGVLLGLAYSSSPKWNIIRFNSKVAFLFMLGILGFLTLQDTQVTPFFVITDERVIEYANDLGLNWYTEGLTQNLIRFYRGQ